uniref:Partial AB-hydrolase lipase domain-containing protein n=1 Tax=Phlebotomus papatasi TaxID=29031 RepID=A0A1B0DL48_PHLPP
MIESYGYPVETHVAQTADGYRLTMHRIPYGRAPGAGPAPNKPIAFLQHGLLCSSADWVVIGPDRALAYLLADEGYDVWMGNARGNTHSRDHISINPDRRAFWDFSWHEIGILDLPAMIDYVFRNTGQSKLHYVGHSQGTTSLFIMLSLRPEYNDVILSAHALAPVAFMNNLRSPFVRAFAPFVNSLDTITSLLGMNEFMPSSTMMQMGGYLTCRDTSPFQELYNSGHFRQFDHGRLGNMAEYGSFSPPDYPLDRITAPIALHFSDNDWLAAVTDVHRLRAELRNVIGAFRVPLAAFNHLDFQWAVDIRPLLYNRFKLKMDID